MPVPGKVAYDPFRLLEGLYQPVQQQPIEATAAKPDAILMVVGEGVYGQASAVRIPAFHRSECTVVGGGGRLQPDEIKTLARSHARRCRRSFLTACSAGVFSKNGDRLHITRLHYKKLEP